MLDIFEWFIDSILDIWDAARKGIDERNQEIAMKLLPVLLVAFLGVIVGIIWFLERG